jgi:hypothetical protein
MAQQYMTQGGASPGQVGGNLWLSEIFGAALIIPSYNAVTVQISGTDADGNPHAADPAATHTDFVNAISSAASAAYSTLLPLADIGNALLTSLPAYDLSLFTDNLSNGDIVDALGLPLAANTGMDTLFAGFALAVVDHAATEISADFSGLF